MQKTKDKIKKLNETLIQAKEEKQELEKKNDELLI